MVLVASRASVSAMGGSCVGWAPPPPARRLLCCRCPLAALAECRRLACVVSQALLVVRCTALSDWCRLRSCSICSRFDVGCKQAVSPQGRLDGRRAAPSTAAGPAPTALPSSVLCGEALLEEAAHKPTKPSVACRPLAASPPAPRPSVGSGVACPPFMMGRCRVPPALCAVDHALPPRFRCQAVCRASRHPPSLLGRPERRRCRRPHPTSPTGGQQLPSRHDAAAPLPATPQLQQ